ncbi:MAG: glycosyltransferase family 2 protein [Lachnospiraceae bacterium]|nr:glycosyltransferase family 2 protein [Lachnospiraceae bacterium]
MTIPILYIVIPCYNEEKVLAVTAPMFRDKLMSLVEAGKVAEWSRVLFVNDGSRDGTWDFIQSLSKDDSVFEGLSLSRNQGHQNALLAGLMEAKDRCDVTISMDCDGQDDPDAMDQMLEEYQNGAEIVYGVRNKRTSDSFFKRFTAESYYKLLNKMGGEVVYNHADYRLVSSRVLQEFANFEEVNIFLRGMFPLVGFKSTCVYYERRERLAGESRYPLAKMMALAFDGITSLSIRPIRFITGCGAFFALVSMILIIYVLVSFFSGNTVPGWSSNLISVCLIGGIQLISLGVIGEYIGKIYLETKHRPRYIIEKRTYEGEERT